MWTEVRLLTDGEHLMIIFVVMSLIIMVVIKVIMTIYKVFAMILMKMITNLNSMWTELRLLTDGEHLIRNAMRIVIIN